MHVAVQFVGSLYVEVLHLMRCPSELVWDNQHKLCMKTSTTCHQGLLSQTDLDNNYVQFFASPFVRGPPVDQLGLLNNIKYKQFNDDERQTRK